MGRKQKERQKKKKAKYLLTTSMCTSTTTAIAVATSTASATATATACFGDSVDGNNNNTTTTGRSSGIGVAVGSVAAKKAMCYHGSEYMNFIKGSYYQMVIDEYVSLHNMFGTAMFHTLFDRYTTNHASLLQNPDFITHVFALATAIFWTNYGNGESLSQRKMLLGVLNLGLMIQYTSDKDTEKRRKYFRDCFTNRGIINVLYRETHNFCNCMVPLKVAVKGLEKRGMCNGCNAEFPKTVLKRCSGCLICQYCSND